MKARGSKLEHDLAAQLNLAGIRYERELRFFMGRRFRADFVVLPAEPSNPPQAAMALVDIHGTGPGGRHGSYGHLTNDAEKMCLAVALGWRYVVVTAEMVKDGRALAVVEALVCGKALPPSMTSPTRRTRRRRLRAVREPRLSGRCVTLALPARVRKAAGLA